MRSPDAPERLDILHMLASWSAVDVKIFDFDVALTTTFRMAATQAAKTKSKKPAKGDDVNESRDF